MIELATAAELSLLIPAAKRSGHRVPRSAQAGSVRTERPYTAPIAARRRCQCGVCPSCQDNARWERIFNEKFADPYYYAARTIKRGSSLGCP